MILRANTALADQSSWVSNPRAARVWSGPGSFQNVATASFPTFGNLLLSLSRPIRVCPTGFSDDGGFWPREKADSCLHSASVQALGAHRTLEMVLQESGAGGPLLQDRGASQAKPRTSCPIGVIKESFLGSLLNSELVSPNLRPSNQ